MSCCTQFLSFLKLVITDHVRLIHEWEGNWVVALTLTYTFLLMLPLSDHVHIIVVVVREVVICRCLNSGPGDEKGDSCQEQMLRHLS